MGISRFLNPEVISPNKEYIGVGNLKQDVLDLIGVNYDEAISELNQKIDTNIERIDSEMSKKENYPILIKYGQLVALALGNALIPGQKYIITDYKTTISQSNISVVDGLIIMNQLVGQRTNMTISTSIVVEADTTSTLKEDARLIRHFYNDIKGNIISFNRSYDVKYDLHPTGSIDTAKVGFVPSGQFVTLKASAPGTSHILDENCELLQYYTCKSYYCTDYTLKAYDENKVFSKFLQFTNGVDNVYVRMPNDNDYPEITNGTQIYMYRDGGTSQSEDDTCTVIGTNIVQQYTGYVYHMKDEFDNEADYEFDLILKDRQNFAFGCIYTPLMYSTSCRGYYKNNKIYGLYKGSKLTIDYNAIRNDNDTSSVLMMNNIISENCDRCFILAGPGNMGSAIMNNFIGNLCSNIHILDSSNNNIGFNSVDVTIIGSDGNEIGPYSSTVTFDSSSHNTLGNNSNGISLIYSSSNVMGNHSQNIQLDKSSGNRIENQCSKIFLRSSSFNTFGMMCSDIIFGGNFINNTIGNDVTGIRFKTSDSLNATDLTSIRYANIGDGVKGLVLYARPIKDETGTVFYQNFDIANGLCEFKIEEPKFLQLPISPNSEYMTYITKDTSGRNIVYSDGDVVNRTNDIGDVTRLNTRDRTSVVAAVNEVNNTISSHIASDSNTFVSYTQQTLTEEQQKQARLNIGLSEVNSINYDLNVKAINHRGYSYEAPENTIPAYIMSKHKGFTYVEGDVSFTEDNVAVLLHDATINRTSDGKGDITTLKYQEVLQYDFGSWFSEDYKGVKIPTFIEWITLCKNLGLHPYIELKSTGGYTQNQITQIVNEVEKCGMKGKVTYISFSDKFLGWVKTADPYARLGFLTSTFNSTYINKGVALKTTTNDVFMDVKLASVNESGINTCISKGLPLEVWTVNEESEILSMPAYVNGVTSDYLIAGKVLYENSLIYTPPTSNWVPTTGISLDKSTLAFSSFEPMTLVATVEPSNSTEDVEWKSSNNTVAVVNNGVVSPLSDGNCTITVTSGKYSASCNTTVAFAKYSVDSTLSGCSLSNPAQIITIGDTYVTEVIPDTGYSLKNAQIRITLNGEDITPLCYNNGIITIENVTGNIRINVTCVEVPVYNINRELTGCTSNKDINSIGEGNPYTEQFILLEGFRFDGAAVLITMGGKDITASSYKDGVLNIPEVTGDIIIHIAAEAIPVYSIVRNLVNCTSDKTTTSVYDGDSYTEAIIANDGYTLRGGNIVITMGGKDITPFLSNTGVLSIDLVTGDIVINVEAVEYNAALPIVDLDLANVGADGIIRNLGTGGSTYDATIQTTSTSDTFSASAGTGLTLNKHAYANVPYVLKGTDKFTIICKGKIATKSSQTYQRFFRTDTDAPSWYYSKSNTKLQAKLSGKNSSESTISVLGSLVSGLTGTNNSGNSVIFNTDTTTVREVMFTCDGTDIKLYINGQLSASQPASGFTKTAYIGIGDNNPDSKYYATALEINRFAIYDSVITDDIIAEEPVNIRLTNENLSQGAISAKNESVGSATLISPYRTNMATRAATAADLNILVNGGKTISVEAKDKNGNVMQVGIQTFGDDALEALSNGESLYPYIIDSGWISSGSNYQIPITHKYAWIVVSYPNTSTNVNVNNIDYIQITELT
jgi:glycerophosphoryl diester phosphodiesterase